MPYHTKMLAVGKYMKQYSIFPNGKFQHLNLNEKETWCGLKTDWIGVSNTNNRATKWPLCTKCIKEHDATVCCVE